MKKKLLIIANYYFPDVASTAQLLTDLCLKIKDKFDITVIAAIPNYSEKIVLNKELKNKKFYFENIDGVMVCRIVAPNVDKNSKISRIEYIFKYYFNTKKAIRYIKEYDIAFSISQPPILGGLLGKFAKKINSKSKFIYNIQDFNPEQIEAVKYIKSKIIINLIKKIDNKTLEAADKIVVVGNDQLETINNRSTKYLEKTIVINNWINEREIYPLDINNNDVIKFKEDYNLNNKFVLMYSGNLGLFYDLENLIKVSKKFKNIKDMIFVFVGAGAKKKELEKYKQDNELENIVFIPYRPKNELNISLNAADVHFVVNAKGIKGVSVPSKIYGVLSSGKYVIGVLEENSEARNIINKAQCGRCVSPCDYDGFEKLISYAYKNRNGLADIGMCGRKYLENNLSMDVSISKYENLFNEL